MHIVAIAWMFVVVLMTLTEATSSQGSVLGAFFTFVLYGVLPLAIVLYLMGTPLRRRARHAAQALADAQAQADTSSATPADSVAAAGDGSRQAAGDGLAPVRKEP